MNFWSHRLYRMKASGTVAKYECLSTSFKRLTYSTTSRAQYTIQTRWLREHLTIDTVKFTDVTASNVYWLNYCRTILIECRKTVEVTVDVHLRQEYSGCHRRDWRWQHNNFMWSIAHNSEECIQQLLTDFSSVANVGSTWSYCGLVCTAVAERAAVSLPFGRRKSICNRCCIKLRTMTVLLSHYLETFSHCMQRRRRRLFVFLQHYIYTCNNRTGRSLRISRKTKQ